MTLTVVRRGTCATCNRGRLRITGNGGMWKHKPYTRASSGEMVPWCTGSGKPPKKRGVSRETTDAG